MTCGEAEKMVKKALSKKRFTHTVNVRDKAVELAALYGASEEKAALAALLHDAAKELPKEELLQILRENAIIAGDAENSPPPDFYLSNCNCFCCNFGNTVSNCYFYHNNSFIFCSQYILSNARKCSTIV